jgi:hypothetical protein
MSMLERLIAPYPAARFVDEVWERGHLHVARNDQSYFDWLFSPRDLDALLCRDNLRYPAVRLFLKGQQLEPHHFTRTWDYDGASYPDFVDLDRMYALLDQGSTINILDFEGLWASVAAMTRGLEVDIGASVNSTAFLTPATADNIPAHYDMVDVFALQISGSKRWRLWPSVTGLPVLSATSRHYSLDDAAVSEDRLVADVDLKAGDTLFVPRGMIHQAITTDSHALHITVMVNPTKRWDILRAAAEAALRALASDPDARRAVLSPCRSLDDAGEQGQQAARLIDVFARELEARRGEAVAALDEHSASTRYPARPGYLASDAAALSERRS